MLDKVFGNDLCTGCAWCLYEKATEEYIGLMAGEEYVRYQVCDKCYKNSPNLVSYDLNKEEDYYVLNSELEKYND